MKSISDLLVLATIALAVVSAAIMIWYLISKPPLTGWVKVILLLGIFAIPLSSAMSGNIAGYEATQKREFCGGCHVMLPWTEDAEDPNSTSLAAIHARNELFGDRNCYRCHEDYAMFGAVTTKMTGMVHAYHYYASYLDVSAEDALAKIALYKPYPNHNCMHCHSTEIPGFMELEDHKGALETIREGEESCVSSGCHGPAHPFSKVKKDAEGEKGAKEVGTHD